MGAPSPAALADAIRLTYQTAGVRQSEIAEAADVDQSTVSAWVNGKSWPPVWALPIIEDLCDARRGHLLRRAGFVDDLGADVVAAITQDTALDADAKPALIGVYEQFRKSFPADIDRRIEVAVDAVEQRQRRRRRRTAPNDTGTDGVTV